MLIYQTWSQVPADKVCLIHGDTRLTYGELQDRTEQLAKRLAVQIRKGDSVIIKLSDPVRQLLYLLAVIKAGGSGVLIDPQTSEAVTAGLISRHQLCGYIDDHTPLPDETAAVLPAIAPQDIFLGALSSGSTGDPKLIWRSHQSWSQAFAAQSEVFSIRSADTLFLAGSLVYTANLNACVHMLAAGGTVVIAANGMPRTWLRELTAYQVTAIFMVPANYRRLLQSLPAPLPQVVSMSSVGAKLDRHTVERLMHCFPQARIVEYYGASELGHVSYLTAEELLEHPDSVGKAFPGVKVEITDGVIWVESPYLAPNYQPRATVGDLGRIDADGYLYLLGRKQGVINSGGVKVIPEQVEAVLLQCPGVAEAVVAGVADPIRGQKVCAWLVKSRTDLKAGDVLAFCRQKLLKAYCPQQVIFIDTLPLTSSGKPDRRSLQTAWKASCR